MKYKLIGIVLLLTLFSLQAQSQQEDTIPKSFISKLGHLINDLDTMYVSPNKYKFAFMLENSSWYEHYRIKSYGERTQSLSIAPQISYKLGAYIGWKWIFLGWSIDLRNLFSKEKVSNKKTEFELSLYSSIVSGDVYYRKSGSNFKIRSTSGIFSKDNSPDYNRKFDGFSVEIKGLNAYWVLNHKKFSYPAAYSQSTNQRKSAGSMIAGFSFSQHDIHFEPEKLPAPILDNLDTSLIFRRIKYTDYSLSFGYAYNWVFARNCLFSVSMTPAIAYKRSTIDDQRHNPALKNINFDLVSRAGLVYNNTKYFIGTSVVIHTYDYHSSRFNLNNSFGTIRFYAGFNFLKKKKVKQEE
ncbi:MAG: DUF4421 domain-containing protein [Bacteroidaceae bacterium]